MELATLRREAIASKQSQTRSPAASLPPSPKTRCTLEDPNPYCLRKTTLFHTPHLSLTANTSLSMVYGVSLLTAVPKASAWSCWRTKPRAPHRFWCKASHLTGFLYFWLKSSAYQYKLPPVKLVVQGKLIVDCMYGFG